MKKNTKSLNIKDIVRTKKHLLDLKSEIPTKTQEFAMEVARWIVNRANKYIDLSDIGYLVKDQIKNGWRYVSLKNGVKILNNAEKAVFVEFGVGIVGQDDAHPKARAEGYKYNEPSPYKDRGGSGTWVFKSTIENLDLPQDSVEFAYNDSNSDYAIVTRGAKGVWYAYNAIVDAKAELSKTNGGEIGKIWEDIKARWFN